MSLCFSVGDSCKTTHFIIYLFMNPKESPALGVSRGSAERAETSADGSLTAFL